MKKARTTIRFWLRTDKASTDNRFPMHLIYQIRGQRKYFGIPGIKLYEANWNADDQEAVYIERKAAKKALPGIDLNNLPTTKDIQRINGKLQELKSDIDKIETRFTLDKVTFDVDMVISKLKELHTVTKKLEPTHYVVDFIERFIADSTATHKKGTFKVYRELKNHLSDFGKVRRREITFTSIGTEFLRTFFNYLTGHVKLTNTTAAKQISTLKTLLGYARKIYKIEINPDYTDFKAKRNDANFEVITLTNEEFETLFYMDLSANRRLNETRDIFCLACATGLRYSDLQQLSWEHIRHNMIVMTALKTKDKVDVPLNMYSSTILSRYKGMVKPLPVKSNLRLISNQKLNDNLKELGELAGIDTPIEKVRERGTEVIRTLHKKYELMSIHMGRKTFVTLSLEKGMPIQEVMAFSGHRTYKAFKRYVDVSAKRKKASMAETWGKAKDIILQSI